MAGSDRHRLTFSSNEFHLWSYRALKAQCVPDYPLIDQFVETEQDAIWHAEGDVEIHTEMVVNEAINLVQNDASYLSDEQKKVLILAAFFHDYGKPLTTTPIVKDGMVRIGARGHELIGASLLHHSTPALDIPPSLWQKVVQLVAYHQMPKQMVIQDAHFGRYLKLAMNADLQLLYWLEIADLKGRICDDLEQQLEILELFRLNAYEFDLWDAGYTPCYLAFKAYFEQYGPSCQEDDIQKAFYRSAYRASANNGHDLTAEIPRAFEYIDKPPSSLIVMSGLSGAGKSYLLEQLRSKAKVISLDVIRKKMTGSAEDQSKNDAVIREAMTLLKEGLRAREQIIWDATNLKRDYRKKIIGAALNYGAYTEIHSVGTPLKQCLIHNQSRTRQVPKSVLEQQFHAFQLPSANECHRLRFIR